LSPSNGETHAFEALGSAEPPGNKLFALVMAAFVVSLLINIGILTFVVIDSQYTDTRICTGQNAVRSAVREEIRQAGAQLPTIAYYQEHPEELKKAISDNKKSLKRFAPLPCPKAPFHDTPVI
jgi:hypothetical protein